MAFCWGHADPVKHLFYVHGGKPLCFLKIDENISDNRQNDSFYYCNSIKRLVVDDDTGAGRPRGVTVFGDEHYRG